MCTAWSLGLANCGPCQCDVTATALLPIYLFSDCCRLSLTPHSGNVWAFALTLMTLWHSLYFPFSMYHIRTYLLLSINFKVLFMWSCCSPEMFKPVFCLYLNNNSLCQHITKFVILFDQVYVETFPMIFVNALKFWTSSVFLMSTKCWR